MKFKFLLFAAVTAMATHANAALIYYEGFNYTSATDLSATDSWAGLNSGAAATIGTGSLTLPGGLASSGNKAINAAGNTQETAGELGSTTNTGTVFFSFAVMLTAAPTTSTYSFAIGTGNTNYGAPIFFQAATGGFNIGLSNRSSGSTVVYDTATISLNTVVFIVGSYTFNDGAGNDTTALWINPSTTTFGGTAPTATLTSSGGTDLAGISQFSIRGAAGSPATEIDEIKVGTTYADVTSAVPEPSIALLGALGFLGILRRRR